MLGLENFSEWQVRQQKQVVHLQICFVSGVSFMAGHLPHPNVPPPQK